MGLRRRLHLIVRRLKENYGLSRHGNLRDGFWELVYILFSIRTSERSYKSAYRQFRKKYRSLSGVADAPVREIELFMQPLGLSNLRAKQLSTIARAIRDGYGAAGFNRLGRRDHKTMESYLRGFHGIGAKVAKCVTMYAFDAPSLPVDTHVWRVMSRLGFAPGGRLTEQKALKLEREIPKDLRYSVHVLAISHGRAICKGKPLCSSCIIAELCPTAPSPTRDIRGGAMPRLAQAKAAPNYRSPDRPTSSRH